MYRFTIALAHIQIVYFMAAEQPDVGMFCTQHDVGENPAKGTQIGDDNNIASRARYATKAALDQRSDGNCRER